MTCSHASPNPECGKRREIKCPDKEFEEEEENEKNFS
jgi:hypothetical protein